MTQKTESATEVMMRMMIEIGKGIVISPSAESPEHAAMRKRLTAQMKEIEDNGGIVDIPFELP